MDLRKAALALGLTAAPVLASTPALADFDAESYPPYERCALCHGLFGVSANPRFPHLGGQKPAYLAAQIRSFLDGTRHNDGGQMVAMVTELAAADIPVAVAWFASQDPPPPTDQTAATSAYADLGCAACHDDPADPLAPHLTAQHPEYLVKQMEDFRTGRRDGSDIADMHRALLTDHAATIVPLATYLAATPRPDILQ